MYEETYLSKTKWDSFLRVAPRVRSLTFDVIGTFHRGVLNSDVPAKLLHRLSTSSQQRDLLPALRHLVWRVRTIENVRPVIPFVPTTLEHLELLVHVGDGLSDEEVLRLIGSVAEATPRLRCFRLSIAGRAPALAGVTVASTIRQLTGLSRLELPNIETTTALLHVLTTLPNVVSLELQTLTAEEGLQSFSEALVAARPSLEVLTLHLPTFNPTHDSILPFPTISPLLQLNQLQCLRIVHARLVSFEVEDVESMGSAWPHLRVLHLSEGLASGYMMKSQIWVLQTIAEKLPNLEELGQCFSTIDIPNPDEPETVFHKLRILDVGYSRVSEEAIGSLAEFLAVMCPPGIEIKVSPSPGRWVEHWNAVNSAVALAHAKRGLGSR